MDVSPRDGILSCYSNDSFPYRMMMLTVPSWDLTCSVRQCHFLQQKLLLLVQVWKKRQLLTQVSVLLQSVHGVVENIRHLKKLLSDMMIDGEKESYQLIKFARSNQSNCYNQRPIVFKGDQSCKRAKLLQMVHQHLMVKLHLVRTHLSVS